MVTYRSGTPGRELNDLNDQEWALDGQGTYAWKEDTRKSAEVCVYGKGPGGKKTYDLVPSPPSFPPSLGRYFPRYADLDWRVARQGQRIVVTDGPSFKDHSSQRSPNLRVGR